MQCNKTAPKRDTTTDGESLDSFLKPSCNVQQNSAKEGREILISFLKPAERRETRVARKLAKIRNSK